MTRQEANFKILDLLKEYFTLYPDIRFGQGLSNLGIATSNKEYDIFFQESLLTLSLLKQWIPSNIDKFPETSATIHVTLEQAAIYKDAWAWYRDEPKDEVYSLDGLSWFRLKIITPEERDEMITRRETYNVDKDSYTKPLTPDESYQK